ncbi:hypothetical protein VSDG_05069 [Cytospora chrysosperma]|uniref:Uncharacterized protein n=1 Tax=Cytospora chrysosperma TaxID=252740 RepID=A0A423VYP1_CYTCH|nr:hypothetical protein VSDG_05069 [Valsa sordida]
MSGSRNSPESAQKKDGSINWTPSLSIRANSFHARNLWLSTSDLRNSYNWSGNHTHDQSLGHFGHQEIQRHCGDTLHAYQRPGETLFSRTRAPKEEYHPSPSLPRPQQIELIGGPVAEHHHWARQPPSACDECAAERAQNAGDTADQQAAECQVDIERIANLGADGIDLVGWGDDGQAAEHRPRWGGDFFYPGRVINPFSGGNDELDRRTLIVLSTTNNGYAECLALCRHPDHSGEERASFYHAHAAVFKSPRFKMQDSCYVNLEHTWTIRPDFPVMDLGYIRKDQRRKLMEMHIRIQADLFNRNIEEHGLGERLKLLL